MGQNNAAEQTPVTVEIWADLGCPWCYLGKHRLRRAIAARPDATRFTVRIRSFELHPEFPREPETNADALVRTYGARAAAVLQEEKRFQALVQREGLAFDLDRLSANTFDLHRVMHHAEESGKGLEFFSGIQDRYFAGALNPFDTDTVVSVAESLGLEAARVREVIAGDEYAAAVRADAEEGRTLGARGVPFTIIGRRVTLSGAQSVAGYAHALDEAIAAIPPVATG